MASESSWNDSGTLHPREAPPPHPPPGGNAQPCRRFHRRDDSTATGAHRFPQRSRHGRGGLIHGVIVAGRLAEKADFLRGKETTNKQVPVAVKVGNLDGGKD